MQLGIITFDKGAMDGKSINLLNPISLIDPIHHIERAIKAGFRHFEITYDINTMMPGIFDEKKIAQLQDIKMRHDLTYSVHLPLWAVELACPHPHIRLGGQNLAIEAINAMEPLKPEVYVLHATGALAAEFMRMDIPQHLRSYLAKYMLNYAFSAINQILDQTHIPSRKIAVECIEFPFEAMDDMIDELDLSICMDVGHILAGYSGGITIPTFINKYFDRIIEIHLHDAYRRNKDGIWEVKDHIPLGEGELDYVSLFEDLVSRGYDKRIIFELDLNEAVASREILRQNIEAAAALSL